MPQPPNSLPRIDGRIAAISASRDVNATAYFLVWTIMNDDCRRPLEDISATDLNYTKFKAKLTERGVLLRRGYELFWEASLGHFTQIAHSDEFHVAVNAMASRSATGPFTFHVSRSSKTAGGKRSAEQGVLRLPSAENNDSNTLLVPYHSQSSVENQLRASCNHGDNTKERTESASAATSEQQSTTRHWNTVLS